MKRGYNSSPIQILQNHYVGKRIVSGGVPPRYYGAVIDSMNSHPSKDGFYVLKAKTKRSLITFTIYTTTHFVVH